MIRLDDFLVATGGRLLGPAHAQTFDALAYDSRIVSPGELFLAVVTETGNGHDYIAQACRAGATGVVCQCPPGEVPSGVTCIVVDNTQEALTAYARYILAAHEMEVVGITGSVGKTSTKEAIAAVLAEARPTFYSQGSYNGRFGLPIALGRLEEHHRLAVLEMACDGLDEIRHLADMTRPRVGVVTAVGHSHLEYFGTPEAIAREKGRLVEALPADGLAVLNRDDPRVRAMAARTVARVVTYGLDPVADVWGENVRVSSEGTTLDVHAGDDVVSLGISLLGAHHAYTVLAAAAVGREYGLDWGAIARGLRSVRPMPGRTRLLPGAKGSLLLDDSYNASPASALAALDLLRDLPAKRRIVVLGDMVQLGAYAVDGHRLVGRRVAEAADVLVTKGELARIAADEALAAGMAGERVHVTYTSDDAAHALQGLVQSGDLALFKGSAEARLEHVVRELLAEPERAEELLPRQHRGWAQVRLMRPGRPTWVEIDLNAIAHNVRSMAQLVGPDVEVMAVLKADGYGHGAIKTARTALNNGASWLGVACLGEAIELRRAGMDAPILSLGFTPPWQAREAVLHDVTAAVFSIEVAEALSRAAADLGRVARVHVKVDTGMGRLGLMPEDVLPFVRALSRLDRLDVDGIFTHFSVADEADLSYTLWQKEQFDGVLDELRREGLLPRHAHAANSAATLRLPESRYTMVRPGIALYGLNPSADAPCPAGFRPALAFKCQVAQVKEMSPGRAVGYGRAFVTERASRIAVVPVGYADGFRRSPTHWGEVLVRGRRAPIVGRVCMDQTMIDVTDIPGVRQGDEVVLIGRQGDERITVDEVAQQLGTINYEVVSEILARVPRVV
jgi:alanine racemase